MSGGVKREVQYKESDVEEEGEVEEDYVPMAKRVKAEPVEIVTENARKEGAVAAPR